MIFRKGGLLPKNLRFLFDGNVIDIVSKFNYLGMVFTTGGSLTEAQTTLAGQAQKAIFKLNKYLYKFTFLAPKHKLDLFDKLITPILNYSSEVWGFNQALNVERVHLQFCKKILGVKKNTQNDFIYGELGRTSFITRRYLIIIKYWLKILKMSDFKYVKIVYKMMVTDFKLAPNKINWAFLLKHLLASLGFYHVWLHQEVGNDKNFLDVVNQRLTDNFIQNWHSRLENSSRATFYQNIAVFQLQPYLNNLNVFKFCQALTKLRVSSHRLQIEAGRWVKPNRTPINERVCIFCNVLEDEFHFVLECKQYIDLRTTYISKYYWDRPSMVKFIDLINTTNKKVCHKLSVFIFKAFENRNAVLYNN